MIRLKVANCVREVLSCASEAATTFVAGLFATRSGSGPAACRAPPSEHAGEPDDNEFADAPGWCRDLESMAADSVEVERWSAVTTPTLLMRGADTWQPMPATLDRLATALPHVTYTTFPDQMHFAPSVVPEEVATEIARFLPRS
ncbi:alpha/beta fold hydrolase [Streptomyces anulatus]|uniref:alpha/beta fold hydrolase n=1 Tax=Streptomyces anulatus TaxID=1892 RepID=UPI0036749527